MKKIYTLYIAVIIIFAMGNQTYGQNIGIGTASPAQKLEISGSGNTIRIDGLITGGTFNTTGATNSNLVYVNNVTGDLYSLPTTNNAILTTNSSGVPTWATSSTAVSGATGQILYGTGSGSAFTTGGTTGQVLQFNTAGVPTWVTPTVGTVTSVATGNGLTGGPITTSGTISLVDGAAAGQIFITGLTPFQPTLRSVSGDITLTRVGGVTVTALQGTSVSATAPTAGQVLEDVTGTWTPTTPTLGTVTSFSSGNLTPLFTTSVATATSTPALTFNLSNAGAYTILGNNSNTAAVPAYFAPALTSALFANQGTTTTVLHGNAAGNPSWGAINLTTDVTGTLPVANGGTGTTTLTADGIVYGNGTGAVGVTAVGTAGQVLQSNGTGFAPSWVTPANGTVTSVALALPSIFTVSGSPVTTSGTLTGTLNTEVANTVFAGPTTGAAAAPTFRALVAADVPSGSGSYIQNQIAAAQASSSFWISGTGVINTSLYLPALTGGSVPFAGAAGLISQNNADFFWNNTTDRLGLGTASPNQELEIGGTAATIRVDGLASGGFTTAGTQTVYADVNGDLTTVAPTTAPSNDVEWSIYGNTGTTTSNFIGTISNVALIFKTDNIFSGILDPTKENATFGPGSGAALTTGVGNTASGYGALASVIKGASNVAIGKQALFNSTVSTLVAVGDSALATNSTGTFNTGVGYQALAKNSTAKNNTAIGYGVLKSNSTGANNTAAGSGALDANATGNSNSAFGVNALGANTTGDNNVGVGDSALTSNTIGVSNTGLGYSALGWNTSGSYNTAVGDSALQVNISGYQNTAVGYYALQTNTLGYNNTGIGTNALNSNTTGHGNTAVGFNSLESITTNNNNSAFGMESLWSLTGGAGNTAMGYQSLASVTGANFNTAMGSEAMSNATTGADNTSVGYAALENNTGGADNTAIGYKANFSNTGGGSANVAIGSNSLYSNSGNGNTAIGFWAMRTAITGNYNTVTGDSALYNNLTGSNNSGSGFSSLYNTLSSNNTAFGFRAAYNNTNATSQTAAGYKALYSTTTGSHNTAFGDSALYTNTTGTNNTTIGYQADASSGSLTNATAIGANATVSSSNMVVLGNNASVRFSLALMPGGSAGTTGQILQSAGAGAAPTWNAITLSNAASVMGTLPVANGGTGVTTFGGTNTLLFTTTANTLSSLTTVNNGVLTTSSTGVPTWLGAGSTGQVLQINGSGAPVWATIGGTGTVTSVALTAPSAFTVTGSPITGAGTLAITGAGTTSQIIDGTGALQTPTLAGALFANQGTTTTVLHGNAAGNPSWGTVNLTTDVSNTLPVANGGTGATTLTSNGILYGNGTGAVTATAAGTTGQVLTNSSGTPKWEALGGVAAIITPSAAINTTETSIVNYSIPANVLSAGTTFRLKASGICTTTVGNISGFRVRIGTTGGPTDALAVVVAPTAGTTGTNVPFSVDELVTIQTTGTSGTVLGSGTLMSENSASGVSKGVSTATVEVAQTVTAVAVNTTVANTIQLSYQSAATTTTCTFYNATIEVVKP